MADLRATTPSVSQGRDADDEFIVIQDDPFCVQDIRAPAVSVSILPPITTPAIAQPSPLAVSARQVSLDDLKQDRETHCSTPKSMSFASLVEVDGTGNDTDTDSVQVTLNQPIDLSHLDETYSAPPSVDAPSNSNASANANPNADAHLRLASTPRAANRDSSQPLSISNSAVQSTPVKPSPVALVSPTAIAPTPILAAAAPSADSPGSVASPAVPPSDAVSSPSHSNTPGTADKWMNINSSTAMQSLLGEFDLKEESESECGDDKRIPPRLRALFDKFERCLQCYQEDELFQAKAIYDELIEEVSDFHEDELPFATKLERFKNIVESNADVVTMNHDMENVYGIMHQIEEKQGWIEVANKKGIQTAYKQEAGNPVHTIRVQGDVDTSLFQILTLVNESDLFPNVVPLELTVKKLKQVSRFRQLVYVHIKLPWPWDDRDAVLLMRGVDMLHQGAVVVIGESCSFWGSVEIPPPPSGCVRLEARLLGGVIKPISDNKTSLAALSNLDLNMNALPTRLLNWFSRHLAFYGFELFRDNATKLLGSRYEGRIVGNPEVYESIQNKVKSFFRLQQLATATAPASDAAASDASSRPHTPLTPVTPLSISPDVMSSFLRPSFSSTVSSSSGMPLTPLPPSAIESKTSAVSVSGTDAENKIPQQSGSNALPLQNDLKPLFKPTPPATPPPPHVLKI